MKLPILLLLFLSLSSPLRALELRLAAIQMPSIDGDVAANLAVAERWLNEAASAGAELVLFPEFMPIGYHLGPDIWQSAETLNGTTVTWIRAQSQRHGVWLATTLLEVEGEDFYNTFVLTNPKGQLAGTVRKEVPAGAEAYFFRGESNNHVIDTELGRIGVMICYENYLSQVANKIAAAEVDLLLMPFSFPRVVGGETQPLPGRVYARYYSQQLGVPSIASHKVGRWRSPVPGFPGYLVEGHFPGLSAIANGAGELVAEAGTEAGFVVAAVTLDPNQKKAMAPHSGPYVPELTDSDDKTSDNNEKEVADAQGRAHYLNNPLRHRAVQKALEVRQTE